MQSKGRKRIAHPLFADVHLFIICKNYRHEKIHRLFLDRPAGSAFRAPAKAPEYKVCFGNTHAHCNYSGDIAVFRAKKGLSLDPKNSAESHYELAKENGYDFYFVTDHSQYPVYTPDTGPP